MNKVSYRKSTTHYVQALKSTARQVSFLDLESVEIMVATEMSFMTGMSSTGVISYHQLAAWKQYRQYCLGPSGRRSVILKQ